jgi:hypothetical protein
MKKLSKERMWQINNQLKGLCTQCGKPSAKDKEGNPLSLCFKCGDKNRKRLREKYGYKPKKKNGKGRPIKYKLK